MPGIRQTWGSENERIELMWRNAARYHATADRARSASTYHYHSHTHTQTLLAFAARCAPVTLIRIRNKSIHAKIRRDDEHAKFSCGGSPEMPVAPAASLPRWPCSPTTSLSNWGEERRRSHKERRRNQERRRNLAPLSVGEQERFRLLLIL